MPSCGSAFDLQYLARAFEIDIVAVLDSLQIVRAAKAICTENLPERRVFAAQTPESKAADIVGLCRFQLVISGDRVEKPYFVGLSVVLAVAEIRIFGLCREI